MARAPFTPRDTSRRRIWVYLAIVAFILVDIVLIVWALGSTRAGATEKADPAPTFEPAEPAVAEQPAVPPAAVPPTRLLSAFDATTAWRATTGPCPATPASPELTTDSGATWTTTDATGPTEVTAPLQLTVEREGTASLVGLNGSDCAPQLVKTFVSGADYGSYPDQLASAWFVDPADRASVHSPAGTVAAPCDTVITLATRGADSAAVLCAEGEIFTTTDAATSWSAPTVVPGTLNLTALDDGYLAAAVGQADCAGVQLLTLSPEGAATVTSCFPVLEPVEALPLIETLPGNVALSEAAGTLWLWVGDVLTRSIDGGATWE